MNFTRFSGLAGIGFVVVLVLGNVVLLAAGFPTPSDAVDLDAVAAVFAAEGGTLRLVSALLPAAWLLATVFAVGVASAVWRRERARGEAWSLVGLAGILMQSVTFAAVEATRLALASAAVHDSSAVPGLWGLYNALFGFNQVFLATALVGLSLSGRRADMIGRWHAFGGLTGAGLLFASATASPYGSEGANPLAALGLAGWLLWLAWIVAYGVVLIRGIEPRAPVAPAIAQA